MARRPGIDTSEYYDPFDENEAESSRGLGGITPCAHIGLATAASEPLRSGGDDSTSPGKQYA